MSLGQSRVDYVFPIWSPKTWKINCAVGKELSSFVSLIVRKSSYVHTNFDKASSLYLIVLMLIYDRQTFFGCFSRESFKLFLSCQYQHLFSVQGLLEFELHSPAIALSSQNNLFQNLYTLFFEQIDALLYLNLVKRCSKILKHF